MKTFKFLACALASLAFAGCSNDDLTPGGEDNGVVTDPTGEAYVSISIKTPETRALHNPNQLNGTAPETKVSKLLLIFFDDSADPKVTSVKDLTLPDGEAGTPDEPTGGDGDAFKVDAASKHLLVVANPITEIITKATVGAFYSIINEALVGQEVSAVATDDHFMMTNAKGALEPSDAAGTLADLTLYTTAAQAELHPASIFIDRVAAKVRVYAAAPVSSFATIANQGWVLNVTNKKFFPCSMREKSAYEMGLALPGDAAKFAPNDRYFLGSYRVDPNYTTAQQGVVTTIPGDALYEANYKYFTSADLPTITWKSSGDAEYCLENTQDKESNMHAYTTQVLFKATVYPKDLTRQDGSTYSITTGDWIAIGSGYYDYDELINYIKAELEYRYSAEHPNTRPAPLFTALRTYLDEVFAADGKALTVPVLDDIDSRAALDTKVATFTTPLTGADKTTLDAIADNIKARTVGTLVYYVDGVNYYKIMINHNDFETQTNELGEFGVVRNSVYDVNITAVNNPGYPSIPDPDPYTPDEDDQTWLSVQININPWTWYTQNVEL